jgi:hypothetical protein
MALDPTTRLAPPVNAPLLSVDGTDHSQPWTEYHQDVADALARQTATLAKVKVGVVDGSDATAGDIGEHLSASSGSVSLTSGANANVVSLSLTAGDWDVTGNVAFAAGSGTHSFFGAGIAGLDTFTSSTFPSATLNQAISTATRRYNVTATTTVWLVAQSIFTGTVTATGTIRARRAR